MNKITRMSWLRGLFLLLSFFVIVSASSAVPAVSLAWDPSPDADVNMYRLYWGPSAGNYSGSNNVGNVTNTVFTQLVPGDHYYFVVTALNEAGAESDPSNEIDYWVPLPNVPPTISAFTNMVSEYGVGTLSQPFDVTDPDVATNALVFHASSSNTNLISTEFITFSGSSTQRVISLAPFFGAVGSSVISVTVEDDRGGKATNSFTFTVKPEPSPPSQLHLIVEASPNLVAWKSLTTVSMDATNAASFYRLQVGQSSPLKSRSLSAASLSSPVRLLESPKSPFKGKRKATKKSTASFK